MKVSNKKNNNAASFRNESLQLQTNRALKDSSSRYVVNKEGGASKAKKDALSWSTMPLFAVSNPIIYTFNTSNFSAGNDKVAVLATVAAVVTAAAAVVTAVAAVTQATSAARSGRIS